MAKGAGRIADYTLYILDRNVRMATVIGHVGTILLAIFLLVLALDQLSSRLRKAYL